MIILALFCLGTFPAAVGAQQPAFAEQPILLEVDATEAPRGLFHAKLVVPAKPGPLTLYYPKWIPGNHGPTGPIGELAGLKVRAGGRPIAWRRDDVDMYAFHCQVPDGASGVEVQLDFLSAPSGRGGANATSKMAVVRWNQMLLYPEGRPIRDILFQTSLRLPDGWKFGTALPVTSQQGALARFGAVSVETLVDSPVLAGLHFREVPLGSYDGCPHFLELACESPAGLEIPDKLKNQLQQLVVEAGKLYGARHYKSYRFLVTLSDHMGFHGLEHHESSDNGVPERALIDEQVAKGTAFLLPHEYTHSWNGKYRRPEGLCTPDFQKAQRTRLLWVYEGLTEYLGTILAARSGLWTPQETRDYIALTADAMEQHRGRSWRPLEDTTLAPPMTQYGTGGWDAWARGVDYYDEGVLIWLEVDTNIRRLTNGRATLDDFCRHFFGGAGGVPELKPYAFEDIVAELNAVAPYDWKGFLSRRLTETLEHAPLNGIEQSGWKLAYAEKPTELEKSAQTLRKNINAGSTVGLILTPEGAVQDVIPGSAAYKAGVGPGMKVLAVNERRWSPERLVEAVGATRKGDQGITLLAENLDFIRSYKLDYHAGAKHACLKRIEGQRDLLGEILKPLAAKDKPSGKGDQKAQNR
jgi:predicted metalloprotease with PDZ domain